MRPIIKHLPFLAILLAYLFVGGLYAIYTPDWQSPDEPAHYNYVRQLANGRFPIMEPSDYDEAYRAQVVSSQFDPQYSIEPLSYEDYQPPLYYLLQTPVFWLSDGNLQAMRLFSVLLGAVTLTLAYASAQIIFNGRRWLALTAVAFIAFLPQHLAIQASMNNDALSELLIAAMLWLLVRGLGAGGWGLEMSQRESVGLALLLGLAFLTKATAYIMAPVIGVLLLWQYWGRWNVLWQRAWLVLGSAVAIGAVWWIRNLVVYGWPDFMGIEAHDAAVIGQLQTADWVADNGVGYALRAFMQTSFQSFWGQFGWMGVVMPLWIYQVLIVFTAVILIGLGVSLAIKSETAYKVARPIVAVLAAVFGLNLALYLGYNVTYVQHQGRYMFASLIPISIGVALGLSGWVTLLRQWPIARYLLPLGVSIGLLGLDLLALFNFIVPSLTP